MRENASEIEEKEKMLGWEGGQSCFAVAGAMSRCKQMNSAGESKRSAAKRRTFWQRKDATKGRMKSNRDKSRGKRRRI